MKSLIFIFFILLIFSCDRKVDPRMFSTQYLFKNNLNLDANIFYFKEGYVSKYFKIAPQEQYFLIEVSGKENNVLGNLELRVTDSVKIEFADGKYKIDYLEDYTSSSSKSIYRDQYYVTENSCPNKSKCTRYIYTIDEQDYAEAK